MSAVIAYVRVSTDDQTTENQKRAIEARYSVAKWFKEEGITGALRLGLTVVDRGLPIAVDDPSTTGGNLRLERQGRW